METVMKKNFWALVTLFKKMNTAIQNNELLREEVDE